MCAVTDMNSTSNEKVTDSIQDHGFKDPINNRDFIVNRRTNEYTLFADGDVGPCPSRPPTEDEKKRQYQEWSELSGSLLKRTGGTYRKTLKIPMAELEGAVERERPRSNVHRSVVV